VTAPKSETAHIRWWERVWVALFGLTLTGARVHVAWWLPFRVFGVVVIVVASGVVELALVGWYSVRHRTSLRRLGRSHPE
jgi:hypothetical protein